MVDQVWLTRAQLARIAPFFPLSHGVPRVDDRRVVSGIIHVIRNGLRWRDAPAAYGPHKTLYNRFVRWSRFGIFNRPRTGWASTTVTRRATTSSSAYARRCQRPLRRGLYARA